MLRYEDDCVGCPQVCIHCGRGRYPIWECDGEGCFYATDNGDCMYEVGNKHYCEKCYEKMFGDTADAVTAMEAWNRRVNDGKTD